MPHEFTVDGTNFRLEGLKLKQALKAEALLLQTVLPAVAAIYGTGSKIDSDTMRMVVAGVERIDELVDLFAPRCKVEHQPGLWVDLSKFLDVIFDRRNAAALAWLVECVSWQFADFFGGNGWSLVEQAANPLLSALGSTGGSGES